MILESDSTSESDKKQEQKEERYLLIEFYNDIEVKRNFISNLEVEVRNILQKEKNNKGYMIISNDREVVYVFKNIKNSTVATYIKR